MNTGGVDRGEGVIEFLGPYGPNCLEWIILTMKFWSSVYIWTGFKIKNQCNQANLIQLKLYFLFI